ncbi:type II toxin-antitoxin system VapC family toxin [Tsukamurella soli]|uniref:PIN domain-containing protein n=1 Tax=Tsukamurella soli TaxID=644556 RepID=A0ABP8J5M3_9ACTN
MTHPKGVLDTSTVLRLDELTTPDLPDESVITTITLAELTVGPLVATDDETRSARQLQVQNAESVYGDPLPFDAAAARTFGLVAAALRATGKKKGARAFDALIAAICISNELPLYTFNARDFENISGLEVVALPRFESPTVRVTGRVGEAGSGREDLGTVERQENLADE